jgi:hypothetical protein
MDAKIDYLSFTMPLNFGGVGHGEEAHGAIGNYMESMHCYSLLALLTNAKVQQNNGRKIYGAGLFFPEHNVSIWWGGVSNHVLIEISGVGCQQLRDIAGMNTLLEAVKDRTTRIDVAVDLPDAGKPADFVLKKKENRFRVTETMDTDTGWTQYVGSRKSERFARVYLYAPPHPRSGVMRVEHVLRGDYAKVMANAIITTSLIEQVSVLGNTFGCGHERWQPDMTTDGKLKAQRHDKDDAATLRWLIKAVAPALIKAHKIGLIDALTFFEKHVLPEIE